MKPLPAHMHEADDNDEEISGTRRSAKQRPPKASRDRLERPEEKRKSKSDTGPQHQYEPIMSGARGADAGVENKLERRKSSASTKSPKKSSSRPPISRNTLPRIATSGHKDHPSQFGIATPTSRGTPVIQYPPPQQYQPVMMAQPIPLRPRATTTQTYPTGRPVSYHAASTSAGYATGPPISSSAYYYQPVIAPSFPPPSPSSSYMRYAATPQPEYFPPQQPPQPYSATTPYSRPLPSRFESAGSRPASAFGMRETTVHQQIQDAYDDGYASATEKQPVKRRSVRIPSGTTRTSAQREADFEAMPPPSRPSSARPGILRNRTTEYHTDIIQDVPVHREAIREARPPYRTVETAPPRRSSSRRASVAYEFPEQRTQEANTSHRRSKSYYGQSSSANSGSAYETTPLEEKMRRASLYQEEVVGPAAPLSAEHLRRHQRRQAGSSKSSGSRDESDYRKSATTHTSQSGHGQNGEDFTITVKGGQARIMVGDAQIDCTEGGEVEIKRQKSIRNGSERSQSIYGDRDERRSRGDRTAGRSRMSSQSGRSYDRPTPIYAPREDYF